MDTTKSFIVSYETQSKIPSSERMETNHLPTQDSQAPRAQIKVCAYLGPQRVRVSPSLTVQSLVSIQTGLSIS